MSKDVEIQQNFSQISSSLCLDPSQATKNPVQANDCSIEYQKNVSGGSNNYEELTRIPLGKFVITMN